MGREAKILLGFLGLLAGVFCGVLSMKLLVPRPPAGAGPDIHGASTFGEATAIVEPPLLVPAFPIRAADFAAAPPLVHEAGQAAPGSPEPDFVAPADVIADSPVPARFERSEPAITETPDVPAAADDDLLPPPAEFVLAPPARHIDDVTPPADGPRDPFVAPTRWQPPEVPAPADVQPTLLLHCLLLHCLLLPCLLLPLPAPHCRSRLPAFTSCNPATPGGRSRRPPTATAVSTGRSSRGIAPSTRGSHSRRARSWNYRRPRDSGRPGRNSSRPPAGRGSRVHERHDTSPGRKSGGEVA